MSCHGRLPQCRVSLKSWPTRPHIHRQGPHVNLWRNSGSSQEAPWLTTILIHGLEGGTEGMKRGEGTRWVNARVDFSVRSQELLTVQALGSLQYVIALYPPLQFFFPVASICQTGFCVCQDFLSYLRRLSCEKGLNSCCETVMIISLHLRQNNHQHNCVSSALSISCLRGLVCHVQQQFKTAVLSVWYTNRLICHLDSPVLAISHRWGDSDALFCTQAFPKSSSLALSSSKRNPSDYMWILIGSTVEWPYKRSHTICLT